MVWICGIGLLVSAGAACGGDDEDAPPNEVTATATPAAAGGSPVADELQAFASENFSLPVTGEASTAWSVSDDLPGFFYLAHAQEQGYIHMGFPSAVYSYDGLTQEGRTRGSGCVGESSPKPQHHKRRSGDHRRS
jgi:hypothetical protein